jgi:hypothetical protein
VIHHRGHREQQQLGREWRELTRIRRDFNW